MPARVSLGILSAVWVSDRRAPGGALVMDLTDKVSALLQEPDFSTAVHFSQAWLHERVWYCSRTVHRGGMKRNIK